MRRDGQNRLSKWLATRSRNPVWTRKVSIGGYERANSNPRRDLCAGGVGNPTEPPKQELQIELPWGRGWEWIEGGCGMMTAKRDSPRPSRGLWMNPERGVRGRPLIMPPIGASRPDPALTDGGERERRSGALVHSPEMRRSHQPQPSCMAILRAPGELKETQGRKNFSYIATPSLRLQKPADGVGCTVTTASHWSVRAERCETGSKSICGQPLESRSSGGRGFGFPSRGQAGRKVQLAGPFSSGC